MRRSKTMPQGGRPDRVEVMAFDNDVTMAQCRQSSWIEQVKLGTFAVHHDQRQAIPRNARLQILQSARLLDPHPVADSVGRSGSTADRARVAIGVEGDHFRLWK